MRYLHIFLIVVAGCGSYHAARESGRKTAAPAVAASKTKSEVPSSPGFPAVLVDESSSLSAGQPPSGEKSLQRKIVYTAEVDLVVENFDGLPDEVQNLVKKYDGFIARSDVQGSTGDHRSGTWTCRVPVARYEQFVAEAEKLGEVRGVRSDSQDVSEEFYDVEARVRNKKQEETRLLEHLKDSTAKLEDILAVEQAISRVREEIERMEGRLRVLTDLSELTTITVRAEEIKDYVPEESPTYAVKLRRQFDASVTALVQAGQHLSIAAIVALPWVFAWGLPLLLIVWLVRRRWARKSSPA